MRNKPNFQRQLEEILKQLETESRIPTLFLHSCCAPCSSYVLEYLSRYFFITLFYYNPNIAPREEYEFRCRQQQRLIREMPLKHPVQFLEGDYHPADFYEAVRGLEEEPEGGARCEACFRLRLSEAALRAAAGGFDYFTTTLSISPMKNAETLARVALEMEERFGVRWLPSDFKKKDGYKRSLELSRTYDLYRQNYCGCVFSSRGSREKQT